MKDSSKMKDKVCCDCDDCREEKDSPTSTEERKNELDVQKLYDALGRILGDKFGLKITYTVTKKDEYKGEDEK